MNDVSDSGDTSVSTVDEVAMMSVVFRLTVSNVAVEWSAELLPISEIPGSDLGRAKYYLHRGFARLCSVFPRERQERHIYSIIKLIKAGTA
jgi:hypothetical protein